MFQHIASQVVVGMVHLKPLPGSPGYFGDMRSIRAAALDDARALIGGGVHAIMVENFGDFPFFRDQVPCHTVASMSVVISAIVELAGEVPVGVNVLRNDVTSAVSIAAATGARFVRANVLAGARVTDQGLIEGRAAEVTRTRKLIDATHVQIWADVDVKHSAPLAARPLQEEVGDLIERAAADALIVSGCGTGKPTDPATARAVRLAAGNSTPIYVGSGASINSVPQFKGLVDGFIVGTSLKRDGHINAPVDVDRVKAFVAAVSRPR